jgi:hypothetical protein
MAGTAKKAQTPPANTAQPPETPQGKKGTPPRYHRSRYSEKGQKAEPKGRYSNA